MYKVGEDSVRVLSHKYEKFILYWTKPINIYEQF